MRLLTSLTSPLGRIPRTIWRWHKLEVEEEVVNPWQDRSPLQGRSAISKIPVLLLDDDTPIIDSWVIAEHLDGLGAEPLLPASGRERLVQQSHCALMHDAITAGTIIVGTRMLESELAEPVMEFHLGKIRASVEELERLRTAGACGGERLSMLDVCAVALLGFLDFRFADDLAWQGDFPALANWRDALTAEHAAIRDTIPVAPKP